LVPLLVGDQTIGKTLSALAGTPGRGCYCFCAGIGSLPNYPAFIETYLRRIPFQTPLDDAPIVRRVSGTLPNDVSVQDYRNHLEEKYG